MGLGQAKSKGGTSNALAKQVDADGKLKYDVIARHGHAQDKVNKHCLLSLSRVELLCYTNIYSYCSSIVDISYSKVIIS